MIKIYSIKEVIEASNNILNRTKSKTKVTSEKKSNQKKNTFLKKDPIRDKIPSEINSLALI